MVRLRLTVTGHCIRYAGSKSWEELGSVSCRIRQRFCDWRNKISVSVSQRWLQRPTLTLFLFQQPQSHKSSVSVSVSVSRCLIWHPIRGLATNPFPKVSPCVSHRTFSFIWLYIFLINGRAYLSCLGPTSCFLYSRIKSRWSLVTVVK